ncbi:unnamed protein product [Symbiodinium pilosum]|uniref:Ubiquitin-like domain-containing protein n=1 Tax=Symbiodinium pilosum TaxID=2952 RepID=A0A812J6T2_SYMPI|nr:unnamed protein product [Symbiodinium pilosum]
MQNLRRTVVQTNADLVLSTQWRKYPQHRQRLREALERSGIPASRIVGETPSFCGGPYCRAQEIKAFLDAHEELLDDEKRWAAVDDVNIEEQDPALMKGHFVKTDPLRGLTEERAQALVSVFAMKGKFLNDGTETLEQMGLQDGGQVIAVIKPRSAPPR